MRFISMAAILIAYSSAVHAGYDVMFYNRTAEDAVSFYSQSGTEGTGECRPLLNSTGDTATARKMYVGYFGNRPSYCGSFDINTFGGKACGGAKSLSLKNVCTRNFYDLTVDPYVPIKSWSVTCRYGVPNCT